MKAKIREIDDEWREISIHLVKIEKEFPHYVHLQLMEDCSLLNAEYKKGQILQFPSRDVKLYVPTFPFLTI